MYGFNNDKSKANAEDVLATNWKNGSQSGSVRTSGSKQEDSSYTIGENAVAEGAGTTASGNYSHAEGMNSSAVGTYAHVEGGRTIAKGTGSHAEGLKTIASGYCSHVQGKFNIEDPTAYTKTTDTAIDSSKTYYTLSNGEFSKVSSPTTSGLPNYYEYTPSDAQQALIIGNGTSDSNRSNALTVDWRGRLECGDYRGNLMSIFDLFYPVGSYYETSDTSFNPNIVWGGTWELEAEGVVHISGTTNGSYRVGVGITYGSNTKRIEDNNIAHAHDFTQPSVYGGDTNTGGMSANVNHSHTAAATGAWFLSGKGKRNSKRATSAGTGDWLPTSNTGWQSDTTTASASVAHTHPQVAHSHTVSGGKVKDLGTPNARINFNVMQASKAVYRWHRTA